MNYSTDNIVDYYNKTRLEYDVVLSLKKHLGMHFGFSDSKYAKYPETSINMNRVLAKKGGIRKNDLVLDAGCGIGGSAIWLAKNIGAKSIGISIVPYQIEKAKKLAAKEGVEENAKFEVQNYLKTNFPDKHFDFVWAVESIGHTKNKKDFFKEAFRILKPKGKLIIGDYFLVKKKTKPDEKSLMRAFLEGWFLEKLPTKNEYLEWLKSIAFTEIKFQDVTKNVFPFSMWLAQSCKKWFPLALIGKQLRILTVTQINDAKAAVAQYEALKKGLWGYAFVIATKS